ncbi:sigma-70 family RNA polymerase sigma factor [Cytobacillus sp. FJAT-54145]|uniref:Sigma-70 family RNA polymerase sigma factor n=1 Tax=Cytobacillus spartinae TaxID=3299023 RepID=A0ABW6KJB4_9BACI
MTQKKLVKAAKSGDDDAFYQLILLNKEKLYRIAYSYLKNETDALEAIQEVTFRAYTRIQKLKEDQFFTTWLVRIMINYCIDQCKKNSRMVGHEMDLENVKELQTDRPVINFNKLHIERALEMMEPKYRSIIELKYFQEFTISEIAEIVERPEGTIKTWLNKGLKGLRSFIHEEGE